MVLQSPIARWCERPPKAPPPVAPHICHLVWAKEMQIWELRKELREMRAILNALIVSCSFVQQQQQQQAVDLDAMD